MNSILSPISVPSVPGCEVRQGQAATPAPYTLAQLVADIKLHLGKEGGIDSSDVDEAYLVSLARKYNSNPSDWAQYYYSQPGKHYTRNSIENINHKANIVSAGPLNLPHLVYSLTIVSLAASAGLESRKGVSDPRPRWCSLHHEGLGGQADRDCLLQQQQQ